MTSNAARQDMAPERPMPTRRAVLAAFAAGSIGAAAARAQTAPAAEAAAPTTRESRLARGAMRKFRFTADRPALADAAFALPAGGTRPLSSWRGRIVLLNFWATWCAPCREEMPALDRLQQRLGGADFEVVTVATDRSAEEVTAFLARHRIAAATDVRDPQARVAATLGVVGFPTTLLIDRQGREIGRLQGDAVWTADEAILLVKAMIGEGRP